MLSDVQIKFYRKNGYLIVENLLAGDHRNCLCQRALDVILDRTESAGSMKIMMEGRTDIQSVPVEEREARANRLFNPHLHESLFFDYAAHPPVLDVIEPLIGEDIKLIQSMFFFRPKGGVGQPYHQDSFYLKAEPDTLIAAWIAIDDAVRENGCLWVIPGSHNDPVHPHEQSEDQRMIDMRWLEVHGADASKEVPVEVKSGDGVLFSGRLLHRGGHNLSDRPRRCYTMHYASAQSKWLNDPGAAHPHPLLRGREYPGCM